MADDLREEIQIMDAESARELELQKMAARTEFLTLPPDRAQQILNEQMFAKSLVPDLSVGFVNPLGLVEDEDE
jgi:hypothetical protein